MKEEKKHLPIYGVGPYYGIGIIVLTLCGIGLSVGGILEYGRITWSPLIVIMKLVGICLIAGGFLVWRAAAVGKHGIDGYIQKNMLCTAGVYSIVRNPCYSGIMMICDGGILIVHNVCLLVLPVVFWIAMTVLMKLTEEK